MNKKWVSHCCHNTLFNSYLIKSTPFVLGNDLNTIDADENQMNNHWHASNVKTFF